MDINKLKQSMISALKEASLNRAANMLFFHNSDSLIEMFSSETEPTHSATYYWFNDHYYHYYAYHPRYFYLFLKKPKTENIRFFIRQVGESYDDLTADYGARKLRIENRPPFDPTILMSKDRLIPDLIADAGPETSKNTRVWTILKPTKYAGKTLELLREDGSPIDFNNIPILNSIFPNLSESLPFVLPQEYSEWNSISYEELKNLT